MLTALWQADYDAGVLRARVAELADAPHSKCGIERCVGSSPTSGTCFPCSGAFWWFFVWTVSTLLPLIRATRYRRPPTNYEAEHCLLRTVRCVNGTVELSVLCEPVFDYGRRRARWEFSSPGYGEAVTVTGDEGDPVLRLTTDRRLGIEDSIAVIRSQMTEGEEAFIALSWTSLTPPRTWEEAAQKQWQTIEYWRQWITVGEFPDHPWREELQRSALTLKGLTYAPTGALIAAPTTSLPETPGGERNWDYRYTWVRDSTFALWALYTLGLDREADDFFSFIRDVAAEDDLQLMYGVGGERDLPESMVEGLGGYDGARPVRIGNAAVHQRQLDVWGTMLDSVYVHTKSRDQLPEPLWPVLLRQVEQAASHWRDTDHGIWEVRGEPQHFTSSKIMCWGPGRIRAVSPAHLHPCRA